MGHQSAISLVRVHTGFMHEPGFAIRIIHSIIQASIDANDLPKIQSDTSPCRRMNTYVRYSYVKNDN